MRCRRHISTASSDASYDSVATSEISQKRRPLWQRVIIITAAVLFVICLLIFLAIWVAVPIAFMESIPFQRFFMFMNINQPSNPDFNHPEKYDIDGVVNFYVTLKDLDGEALVSLGAWLILPEDDVASNPISTHSQETAAQIIGRTSKPIIFYNHGVAANRIQPIKTYNVLRKHFMIIAMDYRHFGDSDVSVELSETGVVNDIVQFYKWARALTNNHIYIWGHSLGTALSTHTVRALKEKEDIIPMGLMLEAPFTTMREEIMNHVIGKIFKWLAYFNVTILDPPERNGFQFHTTTNILAVDCPIMIMHAEDDNVIPWFLGKKLYKVASTQRDPATQGSVTYHQFPAVGYQHVGITSDPQIPKYIVEFVKICEEANKGQG